MKTFEFQCGGDFGSWECMVTVQLTDEQAARLKDYAQDHEFLDSSDMEDIYENVMHSLELQCDEDAELNNVMVWVPFGLKDI